MTLSYEGWKDQKKVFCKTTQSTTSTSSSTTPASSTSVMIDPSEAVHYVGYVRSPPPYIFQLMTNNVTINDTVAHQLMTSLASSKENTNTSISVTQTLNTLGIVMMRSRSSFNISVDGMSLSGIRVRCHIRQ